jgi:preprotein translocase subunit YajC
MTPLILSIGGAIIVILLSIIGYYIVKDNRKQEATNNRLYDYLDRQRESTDKLNISITGLNGVILSIDEKYNGLEKRFNEHKEICRYKTS